MNKIFFPSDVQLDEICRRPVIDRFKLIDSVKGICEEVKSNGDNALIKLTKEYDNVDIKSLKVLSDELSAAHVSPQLKRAIERSIDNITTFHVSQVKDNQEIETSPGVSCFRRVVPIERVGLYIPGGTAPLISTLLMLTIPATIAGCEKIVVCTPPSRTGTVHPAILYAAKILNIEDIYKVGGAQAIAAMAYGTATIPKVYKIFGPGNQYVTAAKAYVSLIGTAIDMPAGPSEVAIITDDGANPTWIASDLLSQAEHGADSQVLLVSPSENIIDKVVEELDKQLLGLPRASIAKESLRNSFAVVVADLEVAISLINEYAPEHLILALSDANKYVSKIKNAGSVFLGYYTPESIGDYSSGTNHVLPTNGAAKAYSGVSVESFLKLITFQIATREGLNGISSTVVEMARAEGLEAHAQAVLKRFV